MGTFDRFNEFWTNTKNRIAGWLGDPGDLEQRALAVRDYQNAQALTYFEGTQPPVLKVDYKTGVDDNLFINYPEMIVDKGVSFLFGDGLGISIDNDVAESLLEDLWPEAARAEDLQDLGTDGAIFGDAWVKIRMGENGRPEVIILDPSKWFKVTDPDNYKKIEAFRCQYRRPDGRYYREEVSQAAAGSWSTQTFESVDGRKWTPTGEPIVWPFPFPPVMVAKNLPKSKSAYGRPDLTRSTIALCKYIARTDSLIGKIVRVHGSPKAVATGVARQDLEIGVDSTLFLKNADAKLALLEMRGDLAGALAFRSGLRQALAETTKIPEIASGALDKVGQLSGRAMQILYGPLIKQTETKRRLYGPLIQGTVRGLLVAGGMPSSKVAGLKIELQWPAPIPPDPREDAEIGILYQQLGISNETIQQRLGFDPASEKEKVAAEQAAADERKSRLFNSGQVPGVELYTN